MGGMTAALAPQRRRLRPGAALLALVALAGCGAREHVVAAACRMPGGKPVERALARAPGPVALQDGTKLSECVAEAVNDAQLQAVGAAFTTAAAHMSPAARRDPAVAERLGYLVGAVERGSARTAGFQAELLFRMRAFVDPGRLGREQRAAAERGRVAGRARG